VLLGGDRDEHGCIGSAGYSWSESAGKCIRPWEEEGQEALEEHQIDLADPAEAQEQALPKNQAIQETAPTAFIPFESVLNAIKGFLKMLFW
jgi:hypothetical protein